MVSNWIIKAWISFWYTSSWFLVTCIGCFLTIIKKLCTCPLFKKYKGWRGLRGKNSKICNNLNILSNLFCNFVDFMTWTQINSVCISLASIANNAPASKVNLCRENNMKRLQPGLVHINILMWTNIAAYVPTWNVLGVLISFFWPPIFLSTVHTPIYRLFSIRFLCRP